MRSLHVHASAPKVAAVKWLTNHRCHDYARLDARWRAVGRRAGIAVNEFATIAGVPLLFLETRAAAAGEPAIYLSSGVHGDEAGSANGLLAWAESNTVLLKKRSVVIFPCLNPHGLGLNTRADHRGLDLNRRFHLDDDEVCGPWRKITSAKQFLFALCLHEDYDAEGAYVYELSHGQKRLAPPILKKCAPIVPIDPRKKIDLRTAIGGVIRPRRIPRDLPGMPEAIVLFQRGCPITLTFETPSEASLDVRVEAHRAFISAAIDRLAPA